MKYQFIFFSFSIRSHTNTPVLAYSSSSSLADTSINHFQFDTRQKRLHVYYVFMHMIAQIIIMMMVANVACTRHELVSKFLILFIVCSLSFCMCVCLCAMLSHSHHWKSHFPLADVALQSHYMTNMHHQIQASKEPHINTSIHACTPSIAIKWIRFVANYISFLSQYNLDKFQIRIQHLVIVCARV